MMAGSSPKRAEVEVCSIHCSFFFWKGGLCLYDGMPQERANGLPQPIFCLLQFDIPLQMEVERLLVQQHALEQQQFLTCEDPAISQRTHRRLAKLVSIASLLSIWL